MIRIPARRIPLNVKSVLRPVGRVEIDIELCKGCHYCIEFCPTGVLGRSGKVNKQGYEYPIVIPGKEEECIGCGMCERICPDYCIKVQDFLYKPAVEEGVG